VKAQSKSRGQGSGEKKDGGKRGNGERELLSWWQGKERKGK